MGQEDEKKNEPGIIPAPPTPTDASNAAEQSDTAQAEMQQVAAPPISPTGAPAPADRQYAGFWIRFLALIIDGIILGIAFIPIFAVLSVLNIGSSPSMYSVDPDSGAGSAFSLPNLIKTVLGWIYYVVLNVKFGGSLGKMALGLKVIDEAGNSVTYATAAIREIVGKIISAMAIMLGYLWVAFDPKKQAWHDKIAKTYVVRK
ncbi:MAG: RDD family protein [Patescibacteria group bacterium]|jgi:uncharacterized RDD family membrane protein YckC